MMPGILYVAAGGAIGAVGRWLLSAALPHGTLSVNIIGSLLMGVLIGLLARYGDGAANLRLFLAVGVLGGFTTFSAFSLEAVSMIERGEWAATAVYIASSVVLSIAGLFGGLWLIRTLLG